jgi:uncharacterized protein involved in type VI secretion and phage assembly
MNLLELLNGKEDAYAATGKVYGVVPGVVTNNQDPEKLGRVKLMFPWLSDSEESNWARVATLMAGADRGSFFLPEVDDEVLVAFEHGDVRFPYVLGMLWNGKDKPRYDNADGANDKRVFTSRGGHEFVFDDNARQGKIVIHTKKNHTITLDDSDGGEKISIVDKGGGNSVEIDSNQNSISVKSGLKLSIESQVIEIKAGGTMKLEATGTMTIKGAVVMIN